MKILTPLFLALAACSADPALREEVAALRAEVREATAPKLEALDAWTELTREVKRLREQQAAAPPGLATAVPAAALPIKPIAKSGEVTGCVSGDLYWVLAKTTVENEERLVLSLYQASAGGQGFKLTGVRVINYDLQMLEMGQGRPHVKDVADELKKLKPR